MTDQQTVKVGFYVARYELALFFPCDPGRVAGDDLGADDRALSRAKDTSGISMAVREYYEQAGYDFTGLDVQFVELRRIDPDLLPLVEDTLP